MDQSNRLVSGNLPLGRLVGNALGEIEQLGYSRRSLGRYRAIWRHLIEFSRQNKLGDEFSGDLAARFAEECRLGNEEVDKPGEGWRRHIVFGVKALADFAHHGRIERARTDIEKIHLLPAMKKVLRDYEQYGKDRLQLRPATLQRRARELTIFLDFLNSTKAKTLGCYVQSRQPHGLAIKGLGHLTAHNDCLRIIDHGRAYVLVSQQFLDRPDVAVVHQ